LDLRSADDVEKRIRIADRKLKRQVKVHWYFYLTRSHIINESAAKNLKQLHILDRKNKF
jgi:hypothetical protein